jgi:hypothetical protein
MHRRGKALFAAALATSVLTVATGSAAANRFAFSEQALRIVWSGESKFRAERVRCPVTLEGSFHSRTISKVTNSLIGFITSAAATQAGCEGGSIRFLNGTETQFNTLPWHWRYAVFTGALPNIVSVKLIIVGASFKVGNCLYRSLETQPLVVSLELNGVGGVTALRLEESATIRRNEEGELLCERFVTVEGRGVVTGIASGAAISVALVS